MSVDMLANLVGYSAAMLGAVMFMPQAINIWKTKQTKGVSLLSFILLAIVSVLWAVYGILKEATPLLLVNSIIGVLSVYIVLMKLKYK